MHADQSVLSVTLALNHGVGCEANEEEEAEEEEVASLIPGGGGGGGDGGGRRRRGEYAGGGTVFTAPVGITARPGAGHVVAFRGSLQHGGAPVTAGVRYIVAAFLFVE